MYCIAIHNVFKSFRAVAKLKNTIVVSFIYGLLLKKIIQTSQYCAHIAYSSW
jgi:hypothetical protein